MRDKRIDKMNKKKIILKILSNELTPSFGCTEPAAVGLATSIAYNATKEILPSWLQVRNTTETVLDNQTQENIEKIIVELDRFTYRNGLDADIPGTGRRGISVAAAQGVFCDPNKKLSIFEDSKAENVERIDRLLKAGKIKLRILDGRTSCIYIRARVLVKLPGRCSSEGIAIIQDAHTNVAFVQGNRRVLYRREEPLKSILDLKALLMVGLEEIIDVVKSLSKEDYDLVRKSVEMNLEAARVGIHNKPGLQIGSTLRRLVDEEVLGKDMINHAVALTSAAVDARMAGCIVPVMSCAGSGNQGLMATLPIVAVAERWGWDEERIVRAIALSYLITCYCTSHLGYLSTLCGGAIKAGVGAAAGIAHYLGGEVQQINSAMENMIEAVTGIICDGAKTSCAIKLAIVSGAVVESALLALSGIVVPFQSGIKGKNLEETIKNVRKISDSMTKTDETILGIMSRAISQESKHW